MVMAMAMAGGGCTLNDTAPLPTSTPEQSRVFIIDVGMATPPLIGHERAYACACTQAYEGPDGAEEEVDLVSLVVATDGPGELHLHLLDEQSGSVLALERVARPPNADEPYVCDGSGVISDDVGGLLAGNAGVYWMAPVKDSADNLRYRATLALRRADRPKLGRLKAFVSETADGDPLGGDDVALVDGFFYLAALGDSVMWGNGLREEDKFRSIVGREIESRLGLKVISSVHAVSGAPIVPYENDRVCTRNCDGEAPTVYTSVTLQAQELVRPEVMDLILIDGCANDINLSRILSPEVAPEELSDLADEYCDTAMTQLLSLVRSRAPNAPIVVNGYYSFIIASSDFSKVEQWVAAHEVGEINRSLFGSLIVNSATFADMSQSGLTEAVSQANALNADDPPIVYVDAGFDSSHAAFAPDAWLWGAQIDVDEAAELGLELRIVPEDPMFEHRLEACARGGVAPDYVSCSYGSLGHPNEAGAQAYADAIIAVLEVIGVLPAQAE